MFGLDDWIAGLSDGGSIAVVVAVAVLLGLRHATDPDHIAAVTTLVASGRERATGAAARLGAWWGAGHALTLVVLLSAIALHRLAFGLALIVAFSVGLAATITAIGLVAVLARRAFGRARLDGPLIRALPALSAAVIVAVGLVITVKAIPAVI